ncbi:hypothetical protein Acr_10g0002670 [Actinidia rufa]|uniref:Uncharacterized protein n=1 Tax=Actinidia rufa TaxID=165716 RepID=A0A7J0F859_9ERIC|nr:hypothetical protein Acr_10g0002670 [Actinidia rufa]
MDLPGSQQPPYSGQSKGSGKGNGRVSDSTQPQQRNSQGKSKYWQPHGVPLMKAHWDSKRLGYDKLQGIFTAPDHWWEKMVTIDKNCGKFRGKTLEHSDLMEQVFGGMTATGRSQWTPSEDLPSTPLIDESSGSSDEAPDDEFGVSSGWKGRTTSEEAQWGKKRADRPLSGNKSASGKKKMSAAARLSRTMDKMLEVVQSQGSEVTVKPHADSNNATIGNCLHLLANLPGIDPLSPLYLLGTQFITIPANREVFMGLPNDDVRLAWLQLHRDQAARTALPPFPGPYTRPPHLPITILDNLDVL